MPTATPSFLASLKSRMVYLSGADLSRLSWKKRLLNRRLCVCLCALLARRVNKAFYFLDCITVLRCVSKKFPPFSCLLLYQVLTDFQNFYTAGKHMNLLQNAYDITHLAFGMLLHYLGKMQTDCIFNRL